MTDSEPDLDLNALVAQVIQDINTKLAISRKNVSVPIGWELSRETIKALHARVYARCYPQGILCRLDMSLTDSRVQARIRVTTMKSYPGFAVRPSRARSDSGTKRDDSETKSDSRAGEGTERDLEALSPPLTYRRRRALRGLEE